MTAGSQTVKFVTVGEGAPDRNNIPAPVRTLVAVPGVRFRSLKPAEKTGVFGLATDIRQLTIIAPFPSAVSSATATGEVLYEDGSDDPADIPANVYQIVGGVGEFPDFGPDVFKVTVLCQKQT